MLAKPHVNMILEPSKALLLDVNRTAQDDVLNVRLAVARQSRRSSPALLTGIFWRALANIGSHRRVLRLLELPPFAEAVQNNPKFGIKYLTDVYLARGLKVRERANCFLHHYKRLYDLFPDRVLRQILHWDVLVYESVGSIGRVQLSLGTSRPSDKEGELSILLKLDGELVFTLSFTIVPGWIVKSKSAEVLLISRLQGAPGSYPMQIRRTTKAMHGVRPRALLFAAAQGFASALGVGEIATTSATRHIAYREELDANFRNAYDGFFVELGVEPNGAGFFVTPLTFAGKSVVCMTEGHKLHAKKRRAFKDVIRSAVKDSVLNKTSRAAARPSRGDAVEPDEEKALQC